MKFKLFAVGLPPVTALPERKNCRMLPVRFHANCLSQSTSSTKLFLLKIVFITCLVAISLLSVGQTKYISKYRPMADSLSEVYGIPSSIILGVAIIESGSGTSRNAKLLNNHFGVKGKNNLLKTKGIRTAYKQYPTVADSYAAFCQLLARKKFYPKMKGNKDYKKWIVAISNAGYSTAPVQWRQKVTQAIQKYKLAG